MQGRLDRLKPRLQGLKGADESCLHLFKRCADLLPDGVDLIPEFFVVLVQGNESSGQYRDDGDHDANRAGQRGHSLAQQPGDLRCAGDNLHHGADVLDHLADAGDKLAAHQQHRTDSSRDSRDPDDGILGLVIQAGQPVHDGGDLLDRLLHHGSQALAKGDSQALHSGFQRAEGAAEAALHGVGHLLGCAFAALDVAHELIELRATSVQQRRHGGEVRLIEDGRNDILFLLCGHAVHGRVQIHHDVVHGPHVARAVIDRYAEGLQLRGCLVCGLRQRQDDIAQVRAALCALDTAVGQNTQLSVQLRCAALEVFGGAAHGQDGFAQLPDGRIRLLRCDSHLVGESAQLIHRETKGRHGVSGQVRGIGKIQPARLRQGKHLRQCRARLVRVISGQSQVVQCLGSFRCGVACRPAHLLRRAVEQGNLPVCLF